MKTVGLFPSAQAELQSDSKRTKKKKKKKAKRRRSSSSSSSSDGDQWVEKPSGTAATAAASQPSATPDRHHPPAPARAVQLATPQGDPPAPARAVQLAAPQRNPPASAGAVELAAPQRDAWMEVENIFAGVTAGEVRDKRRQTKQQVREAEDHQRQVDYEARQWRPPAEGSAKPAAPIGDGGASWLRRALQRAKQQAAESGRPLEEVVAERWGSMEKLQSMLDAAERRTTPAQPAAAVERSTRERGWRRGSDRQQSGSRGRRRGGSRERRRSGSRERRRSGSRERRRSGSREQRRSGSRERRRSGSRERRRSRSRERKRDISREKRRDISRERRRSTSKDRKRSRSNERRTRSRSKDRRRDGSNERRRSRSNERERRSKERGSGSTDRKQDVDGQAKPPSRKQRNVSDDSDDESRSDAAGKNGNTRKEWREPAATTKAVLPPRSADARTAGNESLQRNSTVLPSSPEPDSDSSAKDKDSSRTGSARLLTDSEMNALAAKILKAELNGDDDDVAELQKQLDAARQLRAAGGAARPVEKAEKVVVIVGKGERGPTGSDGRSNKRRKADTHRGAERTKYFADDDRLDLHDMFERERRTTPADEAAALARLTARGVRQNRHHDDEHGLDEQLAERAGRAEPERAQDERTAARARTQHRHLERCTRCFDSRLTLRHLIASLGEKCYLSLPAGRSVTEHHCLIVPLQHAVSLTAVEEDSWEEMARFRAALVAMFAADDQDVVFFESAMKLQTHPHAALHCVPVPRETGELAPIYFKKALEESETEWSQNKKVVDLRGRDVRRAVPKGLPYFFVDFGLQPGFAHVVEDEDLFADNFAQEVIGGMLELDPSAWRRSKNETLEQQSKKAMDFAKIWEPHDFTKEG